MADRLVTPEQRLQLAATRALLDRTEATRLELMRAVSAPLSLNAGPCWVLLRGAADAFCKTGERHPLAKELDRALNNALQLAAQEGPAPVGPAYKGGALRHYERES